MFLEVKRRSTLLCICLLHLLFDYLFGTDFASLKFDIVILFVLLHKTFYLEGRGSFVTSGRRIFICVTH